jgi:hypothetical protein
MTNPDNLGVSHAAQLAIQAVSALPDFDPRTRDREAQLHLHPRRLLLDNPKSLHLYDELSAGEQVLALHKTFHHIAEVVSVRTFIVLSCCFLFLSAIFQAQTCTRFYPTAFLRPRYQDPNRPRRHTLSTTTSRATASSVAAKLSRLLEEDKNIKQVGCLLFSISRSLRWTKYPIQSCGGILSRGCAATPSPRVQCMMLCSTSLQGQRIHRSFFLFFL